MPGFPVKPVLGEAFRLVNGNLGPFARTVGPFVLVAALVAAGAGVVAMERVLAWMRTFSASPDPSFEAMAAPLAASMVLPMVVSIGMTAVLLLALFFAVGAADLLLRGSAPTLGGVWRHAGARLGPFLGAALVAVLVPSSLPLVFMFAAMLTGSPMVIFVTLAVALLAALFLYLAFWYAPVLALVEGRGAGDSLAASMRYAAHGKGSIAVVLLVVGLMGALLSGTVGTVFALAPPGPLRGDPLDFGGAQVPFPTPLGMALDAFGRGLVHLYIAPLTAAAGILAYRDLARRGPVPGGDVPPWAAPPPAPAAPAPPVASAAAPGAEAGPGSCARCHSPLPAGASFCTACGTPRAA